MATLITKNSSTASSVPTAAQLVQGELAVNVTDKRLFTENSSGTVVELGTNPSTLALPNGTANGVAYLNGSKVLTTGSALTYNGTSFGVGSSSYGDAGTITTSIGVPGTTAGGLQLWASSAQEHYIQWGDSTSGSATYAGAISYSHASDFMRFWTNSSEQMRLTSVGLGIGTSSPQSRLEIAQAADNTDGPKLRIANNGNTLSNGQLIGGIDFYNGDDSGTGNAVGAYIYSYTNDATVPVGSQDMRFATGGTTTRMTLDSSGNLGLGVTPSAWDSSYKAIRVNNFTLASQDQTGGGELSKNSYVASGGTNTYIANGFSTKYEQAAGTHKWFTAPSGTAGNAISFTQAMTLTSAGLLGVGVTAPEQRIHVADNNGIRFGNAGATPKADIYYSSTGSEFLDIKVQGTTTGYGNIRFYTGGTPDERARITSGGDLLVGTTSSAQNANTGIKNIASGAVYVVNSGGTDGFSYYNTTAGAYRFYVQNNGTIAATNTTIAAISDQRLKENVRDLDVGLNAIMALKPRKFDWKAGKGKDIKDDRGWIAQEFEQVFPDMIDTWKDEAPEGEEPYKSVRADLIPVLVKAIQEQQALINQLKARLDAANL